MRSELFHTVYKLNLHSFVSESRDAACCCCCTRNESPETLRHVGFFKANFKFGYFLVTFFHLHIYVKVVASTSFLLPSVFSPKT